MSEAENTIRFAILNGIIDQWPRKDDPNFAKIIQQKVFESIFSPHLKWAIEEYLNELNKKQ